MKKYRTCNLCEALCGLEIEIENNQVLSIKGDKQDVFSKGHICPKAYALKDVHEDPDRLKFPMRKKEGTWEQISWEEAFVYATERLLDIQEKHGPESLAIYQGNPTVHNIGTVLSIGGLLKSLNIRKRYSATSLDQLPHHLAAEFMFGHMHLIPIPDINRTDFWLILGGNPLVSNGSLMTAPNVSGKLKAIQERGGKVVVVDPRKTLTAQKADQHFFIRPGTDIWLLLAMLHHMLYSGKLDIEQLKARFKAEQVEEIKELMKSYTPASAAKITGIEEAAIIGLTEEFLAAGSAICYGRLGVSITEHGSLCHWIINLINLLSGNFDQEGGVLFTSPAIDLSKGKGRKPRYGRWYSRTRGLPEFAGELPVSTMAEDILNPGEGQTKALITSCGNIVLSGTNAAQVEEALSSLDFMISFDIYLNETTRHADLILPPATGLETPHLGLFFHNLAVHNSINYSEAVVDKEAGTLSDYDMINQFRTVVEVEKAKRTGEEYQAKPTPSLEQSLDFMLAQGPHPYSIKDLKENPHGIDLGPLKVNGSKERLETQDREINLLPDLFKESLEKIKMPKSQDAFLLIGRRNLRSMNSWLHNSYRMVKGREQCTAQINPDDAKRLQIESGAMIQVSSRVNSITIPAEVSEEVGPGTISIPHGWGHHRPGIKMQVAAAHAGASYSDLADELYVDPVTGNAALNGLPIQVSKVEA